MTVRSQEIPLDVGRRPTWIGTRLTASVAICLITVFCVVASVTFSQLENRRAKMEESAQAMARAAIVALDREIEVSVARLQGLASSPALREPDLRAFYDQLREVESPSGTWFTLFRGQQQILNTLLPFDAGRFPPVHEYDEDARRTLHSLASGKPFVMRALIWSPVRNQFVTGIGVRVPRAADALYMLATAVPKEHLTQILRELGPLQIDEHRVLATVEGDVVAAQNDAQFMTGTVLPDELRTGLSDQTGATSIQMNGEEVLAGYARSSVAPWAVYVLLPASGLRTAQRQAFGAVVGGGACTLTLAVSAAYWLRSRLDRPLAVLWPIIEDARRGQRETEDRFRVFWENTGDGMFVALDAGNGRFILETSNPAYRKLAEVEDADLTAPLPLDFTQEPGRRAVAERFLAGLHAPEPCRFDCDVQVGVTNRIWDIIVVPLPDPANGRADRLLGCVRDVTRSRRTKQALRRLSGRILAIQDEERRRIARELHDSTGQALLGAGLAIARVRLQRGLDMPKEDLAEASALIGQAHEEIRTLSYLLHPPLLDELGLVKALEDYVTGFQKRSGVGVCFTVDPQIRNAVVASETGIALFRVAQEALANAWRHAACSLVSVNLVPTGTGRAVLTIGDNGCGLITRDTAELPTARGVGIASMRERMSQIGGELTLTERPGGGLEVSAMFTLASS